MRDYANKLQVVERTVYAVYISSFPNDQKPVLLNLFSTRDLAKSFISTDFPEWTPIPSLMSPIGSDLGTLYYYCGTVLSIQETAVGLGIYNWLIGAEHYNSPIKELAI